MLNQDGKNAGLYRANFEHDNCGIGFLANMKGVPSYTIVRSALDLLCNLEHRGGAGAEANSGDGAGILLQIPHEFFAEEAQKQGFSLPAAGEYGVGMLFLPMDEDERIACKAEISNICAEEGAQTIGFRSVPVKEEGIGAIALGAKPYIEQVFIQAGEKRDRELERKLYVIRKRAEKEVRTWLDEAQPFYFASLSTQTIVYKGMLTTEQLGQFYVDLQDKQFKSTIALVHSRFSTNTFPSWERAHPNRYLMHNGEINTIKGNVNWMHARESVFRSRAFGDDLEKVKPIIDGNGSDSAIFDNAFEFLTLSGRSMAHAAMMMIPEPWQNAHNMDEVKRSFYQFHSCLMEPWDGPTAIVFTDGNQVGASLDRNGLRPSRYIVTEDDIVVMSSEVGVLPVAPEKIVQKSRLQPGQMLLVDPEEGRILPDEEVKADIVHEEPYEQWVNEQMLTLEDIRENPDAPGVEDGEPIRLQQSVYGYTIEEIAKQILPMVEEGTDPVGSMGYDNPLAVLAEKPQLLYNYFKQQFAQVTNPPVDVIREETVTAVGTTIGREGDLLHPGPENARHIYLQTPILNNEEMAKLRICDADGLHASILPMVFPVADGAAGIDAALETLFAKADEAIADGSTLLVLSDRDVSSAWAPLPTLLAVSSLHHHLIRKGTRTRVSLLVESGEPREVHHLALLLGYGAEAINPYLVFATFADLIKNGELSSYSYVEAVERYIKTATKGIMKVLSKMGISTIQSYRGAQIFEAVGIDENVIDRHFTWTESRIGGIGLEMIARESLERHQKAYELLYYDELSLEAGDDQQWRRGGEEHQYNPHTIHMLQQACRTNDKDMFKHYSRAIDEQNDRQTTLRGLLTLKKDRPSVPLEDVESVEEIFKRFKTGAMSFGSISKEAHEALAIAMNRIGGRSNTGEGGEDPDRFTRDENGDLRRSAIKQVASGRFGVTSHYLVNADEIQIKIAQGAKPGEGGQLPGGKVYPWIASVRGTTAGVGLISPPPHHDIYSIEDLAQLIHDLKHANPDAAISVKLVSGTGVGTIAAGVAKGRADGIVISGYDGGTGAAARTSIKHTGLPWEIGLADTHQTLVMNGLRERIRLETDGKLMTGKDVIFATLFGAEEYAFSTAPLVVIGCVMMRVCHMDTCPVGIATQNPELRKKFPGSAEQVVRFMTFIAEEMRELMAELGFKRIDDMIGRTDLLQQKADIKNPKARQVNVEPLLYRPNADEQTAHVGGGQQQHLVAESLDVEVLLDECRPAIDKRRPVRESFKVWSINRAVGTVVGSTISKKCGPDGLPEDMIDLTFTGSAGQSFGAFIPNGMTLRLIGDANDYIGKGLSGGKIIAAPHPDTPLAAEDNIIVGNTAFYGATSGEAYISGIAGERFGVRNSGANVVVEGVGDHALEYMTGGRVVVLGTTGKNFAAGMSGGIAYVYNPNHTFEHHCNQALVEIDKLSDEDAKELQTLIEQHVEYTNSSLGTRILADWPTAVTQFVKVIPTDYRKMLQAIEASMAEGLPEDEAVMAAFEKGKQKEPV
ncbi:glutamate synthase large subunit [Natribacillus halophilus]|uniref:Glutamate synthase (NADH) large subunit n=1 Tax=Natribacillus halophilus TaxID=549003 RepID=A0A1G8J8F0_9BACI|nr:glutamate synthase large subunit [Natribacillus halophilus]SDI27515.1 glutamate synthase (NADH) large subunit [Natribacillus halophilus]